MINILKVTCLVIATTTFYIQVSAQNDTVQNNKFIKEKYGDEFFGGISNVFGYRTLKIRDGLFAQPLGIREEEEPMWTMSFELGYRVKMSDKLMLEFGMEFNQWGLQYRTPFDSSFVGYNRVNQGFTSPVRLAFQPLKLGEDFIIQLGLGAAPRMFMASRYTSLEINSFGQEEEIVTVYKDGYNSFNIDVLGNLGFRWNVGQSFGLYFIPEFRYGLLDMLDKQRPHIQHNYGLFLRWGLHWLL